MLHKVLPVPQVTVGKSVSDKVMTLVQQVKNGEVVLKVRNGAVTTIVATVVYEIGTSPGRTAEQGGTSVE